MVGLLVVVLRALVPEFPLSDEQVTAFLMMLIAYIVGVALEDGLTRRAGQWRRGDGSGQAAVAALRVQPRWPCPVL